MDYAYKGVSNILLAQILTIISIILMLWSATVTLLLSIVIAVLYIVGMSYGMKEEDKFRSALIAFIFSFVFSVIKNLVYDFSVIMAFFESICTILTTYFILEAIMNLAELNDNYSVCTLAKWTSSIIILVTVISTILSFLIAIGTISAPIWAWIILIISLATETLFIITLYSAKKMLA